MLQFLSLFDTRTTVLLVAIAFFIQANAIGVQAFLVREYRGIKTALIGNLCLALGFLLTTLRGIVPDLVSIVIANLLLLEGVNIFHISVSLFTGQRYNKKAIILLSITLFVILIYYTYVHHDLSRRIIGASLCAGTSVLLVVNRLWRARNSSYRFAAWLTFAPFGIYGLFLYIRAVATIFAPPPDMFANTPLQHTTYLLLFLISFFWTIGFILMVSQRLQADLTALATTDSLTRIPNRHATQLFLERELSRTQRKQGEFSILLIDLDNFKLINDTYGHAIGDNVLISTAQIFEASIRKQDLAGRWGGEEFLMILPDASIGDAKFLAERLRHLISVSKYDLPLQVTISIGIASSKEVASIDHILKKADDALYVAKATKNTTVCAN